MVDGVHSRGSSDGESQAPPAGCDTALGTSPDEVLARWLVETHARALDGFDLDMQNIPDVELVQANKVLAGLARRYARDSRARLKLNPFLTSIGAGCVDAVEMLIRHGASIHNVDCNFVRENARHAAVRPELDAPHRGLPALCACLAAATPFWRIQNVKAFGCARKPDHLGVARCLLEHGADPTSGFKDETPLCYARKRGGDLHEFVTLLEAHPKVRRALKRRTCANCEGEGSLVAPPFQKCACCERVRYCSRDCQIMHWKRAHRDECQPKASG